MNVLTADRKMLLPPLKKLANVALLANAPFVALFMLLGNLRSAVSMVAGCALAMVVYGMLHAIIARGLDYFTVEGGVAATQASKNMVSAGFVALMIGKYVAVGALLFLVWRANYLQVLPFIGGFAFAQIAVTWVSVAETKKTIGSGLS
jgi:hypothetical protein